MQETTKDFVVFSGQKNSCSSQKKYEVNKADDTDDDEKKGVNNCVWVVVTDAHTYFYLFKTIYLCISFFSFLFKQFNLGLEG